MAFRLPEMTAAPLLRPIRTGITLMNMVLTPSIKAVVAASSTTESGRLTRTARGSTSRQTSAAPIRAAEVLTSLRKTWWSSQPAR